MMDRNQAAGTLILTAQMNFNQAHWWVLALAWVFGTHRTLRHMGWFARIGFWRGKPYLLSFRENPRGLS